MAPTATLPPYGLISILYTTLAFSHSTVASQRALSQEGVPTNRHPHCAPSCILLFFPCFPFPISFSLSFLIFPDPCSSSNHVFLFFYINCSHSFFSAYRFAPRPSLSSISFPQWRIVGLSLESAVVGKGR